MLVPLLSLVHPSCYYVILCVNCVIYGVCRRAAIAQPSHDERHRRGHDARGTLPILYYCCYYYYLYIYRSFMCEVCDIWSV
jgi:hypothetical protein